MKGKRLKQYRKLVQKYSLTFGLRPPYQVLVDAQMIQDCEAQKMDLVGALGRTLGDQVKPMITQCSIRHLYHKELPHAQKDAIISIAKTIERRRCNHHTLDHPLSTLDCFKDVIDPKKSLRNSHHYVVASQDIDVRKYCRGIRGVPLIFVKRSVMVMEPMVGDSLLQREDVERSKFRNGLKTRGKGLLGKRKGPESNDDNKDDSELLGKEGIAIENWEEKKISRTRGPKGPNPLAVRKPKKTTTSLWQTEDANDISPASFRPAVLHEENGQSAKVAIAVDESSAGEVQEHPSKKKRKRKHKPKANGEPADAIIREHNSIV